MILAAIVLASLATYALIGALVGSYVYHRTVPFYLAGLDGPIAGIIWPIVVLVWAARFCLRPVLRLTLKATRPRRKS